MLKADRLQLGSKIYPVLSVRKLSSLLHLKVQTLKDLAETAGRYYSPFDRKQVKPNGKVKWRHIDNSLKNLKNVQKRINKNLLNNICVLLPEGMTGGIKGRSVFDNANKHLNQDALAVIDLKDCYPKTTNKRIFRLWRNYLGSSNDVASILTRLTTFQKRLPQGAPTSSSLCNIAMQPLYRKIEKYTVKNNLNLSLYVDDVTISGKLSQVKIAIPNIIYLIQKYGYAVRRNKIEIMTSNVPQRVTGLVTNRKISVLYKTREDLRRKIIQLSKKQKISQKDFSSIEGSINHIRQASNNHADKLENFAHLLLLDKLDKNYYEKTTLTNEETRVCKNTKRHIYRF